MTNFYTIGHSNRSLEDFVSLLQENEIKCLVDVRSCPGSRHCPQFNKKNLIEVLPEQNIRYEHIVNLGGRRKTNKKINPEVNGLWTHRSFHNYADYTLTNDFSDGLNELRKIGKTSKVAYMCSEAVWWRCHRRIITDYLLTSGEQVLHIMGRNKIETATMTKNSVCCDGKPVYNKAGIIIGVSNA